jgi:hypothetical protein
LHDAKVVVMSPFGPLDPLLVVLYAALRLRPLRAVILFFGLVPAILYALPAQPCGCIRTPFVRCSSYGRESAYQAAMKSDLKNLASQEEIFYSDNYQYSADAEALGFVASNGVTVTVVAEDHGWAARATHAALGDHESCEMYYGYEDAPANGFELLEDVEPGELVCTF